MPREVQNLLVLDLESTGPDTDKDEILELGALAIDKDWQPVSVFHRLVAYSDKHEELRRRCDPYVKIMHTKNGLFSDLVGGVDDLLHDVTRLDADLVEWLIETMPEAVAERDVRLVGRSVGAFDYAMIKRWLPETFECLSHSTLDISAINTFMTMSGTPVRRTPSKEMAHRGLDDCYTELYDLRVLLAVQNVHHLAKGIRKSVDEVNAKLWIEWGWDFESASLVAHLGEDRTVRMDPGNLSISTAADAILISSGGRGATKEA